MSHQPGSTAHIIYSRLSCQTHLKSMSDLLSITAYSKVQPLFVHLYNNETVWIATILH